jgi:hypothetical protein
MVLIKYGEPSTGNTFGVENSYWINKLDYCGARTPHTNFFRNPINIATFHSKSTMRTRAITMVKRKYQDGDYIGTCVLSEISDNSNRKTARLTSLSH